jgi:hypothetical protein
MPTITNDPLARRGPFYLLRNELDDFFPGARRAQVERQACLAKGQQVAVPFDESGDREAAAQLDDTGPGPDQRFDFGVGPDGDDAATEHEIGGHRLGGMDRLRTPEYGSNDQQK